MFCKTSNVGLNKSYVKCDRGGDKSDPKRGRANQTLNLGGFKILKVAGRRGAMSDVKYGWRLSHI